MDYVITRRFTYNTNSFPVYELALSNVSLILLFRKIQTLLILKYKNIVKPTRNIYELQIMSLAL